jgi:serine phosphatase RsbU (regulator of sigma subunit)
MDRLIDLVRKKLDRPEKEIVAKVLSDVERFCKGRRRDDIALLAVRTL